jgi:hypothetical protein
MTIKAFAKAAEIERQKLDVQFRARTEKLTPREHERMIRELDRRVSDLRHEAAAELKERRAQLVRSHRNLNAAAQTAAEANAQQTDHPRLNAAHEQARRILKRAKSPQETLAALKAAEASGDKHLQRAVYAEFVANVEGMRPDRLTGNDIQLITLKNQVAPALDNLERSAEQRALDGEPAKLEQQIFDFTQEVARAKSTFKPEPVKFGEGEQPQDVYKGLTDGVRLSPHADNPNLVDVELDDSWNGPPEHEEKQYLQEPYVDDREASANEVQSLGELLEGLYSR